MSSEKFKLGVWWEMNSEQWKLKGEKCLRCKHESVLNKEKWEWVRMSQK